jgi:hypothetical protein
VPKKTVQVLIRVSEEDRDAWKAAAEADEMTLSEWIRRRLTTTTLGRAKRGASTTVVSAAGLPNPRARSAACG